MVGAVERMQPSAYVTPISRVRQVERSTPTEQMGALSASAASDTSPATGASAAAALQTPVSYAIPDANDSKYVAAEMAVRSRITPMTNEDGTKISVSEEIKGNTTEELQGEETCKTCAERKYQDGSDDSSVSFQTPGHIDPDVSASVVRGHEMEHVRNEQGSAKSEGRKILSQSVTLHSSICPECGKTYTSGGNTRTVTAADNKADQVTNEQENAWENPYNGARLDMFA